jgi:hypothetical protein
MLLHRIPLLQLQIAFHKQKENVVSNESILTFQSSKDIFDTSNS